jgi:hypothetical protein
VYSEGDRAGYVQKFSKKGWLCKTWEGELAMASMPGAMPEIFAFTVRDDSVAAEINRHMGDRVTVTYEEHRGVPTTCFGETPYFVVGVRPIQPPAGAVPCVTPQPPGATAPAATPAPVPPRP